MSLSWIMKPDGTSTGVGNGPRPPGLSIIRIWDPSTGAGQGAFKNDDWFSPLSADDSNYPHGITGTGEFAVMSLAFSPDSHRLAAAGRNDGLVLLNLLSGKGELALMDPAMVTKGASAPSSSHPMAGCF